MSGDVQPRKRKDKKRKKDELGVEEPRGTAAQLGEGDVFMHSYHEHGTGGHWCAKVIFFSLLAVLVTLIGLIILENRGLTDLEANAVESRYSGVLEGWLEEAHDDDHHDEHTLELKHHDADVDHDDGGDEHDEGFDENSHEDDDESGETEPADEDDEDQNIDQEDDQSNEYENSNEQDNDDNISHENEQENSEEDRSLQDDEDKEEEQNFRNFYKHEARDEDVSANEDSQETEDENEQQDDVSAEENSDSAEDIVEINKSNDEISEENDNDANSNENFNFDNERDQQNSDELEQNYSEEGENEDDEQHEDEVEEDTAIEVEKLENEVFDNEVSTETFTATADDAGIDSDEYEKDAANGDDDDEFLEPEDEELPIVERITAPAGKPLVEVEETSSEKPPNTLAEEEEYEKQQEELRKEKEQASHLWLKLAVGGALLVATHAVVRRATAPSDSTSTEEHASREETPTLVERRMTLITPETSAPAKLIPQEIPKRAEQEPPKKTPLIIKTSPSPKQESEDEEEEETPLIPKDFKPVESKIKADDKELYSDEDEEPEDPEEEEIVEEKKEMHIEIQPPQPKEVTPEPEDNDEVSDDVEIIDDEQLEEEEDEEVEEEISDVDDAELLNRLEAKYGRLPEPERPGPKHKDGGNSVEDEWPDEPSDPYWRDQLDRAEDELRQGAWGAMETRISAAELANCARARWLKARALDAQAEALKDNTLLSKAITAYMHLLKLNERLSDKRLLEVTSRTLNRIQFRGNYLNAEPVYRLLIRRFPDDPSYRNNLTISFLMANRVDLTEEVLEETLKRWPNDRVALVHRGFVLKTKHNRLEEAVRDFKQALEGDTGPACEPRFYYHLGDALLLLGRLEEANEVHERGAKLGHFKSAAQRSLYNVDRLRSRPWWDVAQTPYSALAKDLQAAWKDILKEGEAAGALFSAEREGLRSRGTWEQLELFVRGREVPGRCERAPTACRILRRHPAAACRRGQAKYSALQPGTHVRPHVGPTNCRLRMHLGLANTKDTYIRVDKEIRQWEVGKVLLFDDSFEHEVWHNGTGSRLVLIVDVWHPDLTAHERATLPAI